ncbi:EAL domain-containing protein [Pleionea sp. CnH1-48]|uniref:sensor domain-containing phosphodiesterase n=1 Tax=Pleionea sp. CnH1-48 TaxID=2954494 RepID=UPI002097F819|nr:EAL domain-containing protein [Pleionea sp. CnH1-48]MCO7224825.1 EAL domain-containing protein [Pleionea sp. CnH1-48]
MPNIDPNEYQQMKSRLQELETIAQAKQETEKRQNALFKITDLSSQAIDLESFYRDLHQVIEQLMYARNIYIVLLTDNQKKVTFEYFVDEEDTLNPTDWPPEPIESFKQTLTGWLLQSDEALLIDGKKLDELEQSGEIQVRGKRCNDWLGVPLRHNNQTIGALVVQNYQHERQFFTKDKELLTYVSQHIATTLQRKKAQQELERHNEELEKRVKERTALLQQTNEVLEREVKEKKRAEVLQNALFKISELTNAPIALAEFYEHIHKIISNVTLANNFYIALFDTPKKEIHFPYFVDNYEPQPTSRTIAHHSSDSELSPTEWVLSKRVPLLINSSNQKEWASKQTIKGRMPSSWLGVPLIYQKQTLGMIAIQSYNDAENYSHRDKEVLSFVAQQVAVALSRKNNADELLATHEELKKINDELEKRVKSRTQELSITNKTLQSMLNEQEETKKQLAFEAFHDSLTQLPNRALFINRVEHLLSKMKREKDIYFSIFFLDLDRFKVINDSLGHLVGDELLKEVSARISRCVRPGDTVARLGGDEFCVLLLDIQNERDAAIIAERILDSISQPYELLDQRVYTSTSIGIVLSHYDYSQTDELLRDADAAMYHAKAHGKARYSLFDSNMHQRALTRLKLENELRHAIERDEIHVFFQPVYNMQTRNIESFEALARWTHPKLGTVSPAEFISIAEEIGFIHTLGNHILDQSLATLKSWRQQEGVPQSLTVSVNFSSRQISHGDLLKDIKKLLKKHQLDTQSLKVEITESLLIENFDLAKTLIAKLSENNIQVMLDDFGTGYSSLSYLNQFALDVIKIDRSFINRIDEDPTLLAIVKTIIYMANQLSLGLVAEGVETEKHVAILTDLGIKQVQGYYFSRPLPADEAVKLLVDGCDKTPSTNSLCQ